MNDKINTSIIEVNGLTRQFGGLIAVNNVSFTVYRHEVFGLIGPNGAGKTTLFNMITGLTPPTRGAINYQARNIAGWQPHRIAQLGIARTFQNIRLFANLSALENVLIAQHIHLKSGVIRSVLGLLPPTQDEERLARNRTMEMLALVGLADQAETLGRNFSYGDQRRLEIARALATQPQVLLLDEPAAGLNLNEKEALTGLIRQIAHQFALTIILIEHNVPLVMSLCDRVAVLDFGQLIAIGLPEVVRADPAVIEAYLGETITP